MALCPFWRLQRSCRTGCCCDVHLAVALAQELHPSPSSREWNHQGRAEPGVCQGVSLALPCPEHGIPAQPHRDRVQCAAQSGLEPLGALLLLWGSERARWVNQPWLWSRLSSAVPLAFQITAFWLFHQCHKISSAVPLKIRSWVHPK